MLKRSKANANPEPEDDDAQQDKIYKIVVIGAGGVGYAFSYGSHFLFWHRILNSFSCVSEKVVSLCDLFLIRGKTLMTPLWVISHFYLIP
jgi:hypothetical protein